ncbi:MAG: type II toxin-antitoxin system RelE/ParE family toxin [Deltaproteobacteria bacterium]|nr:type II toxin-antitoxin system RelE/ParE family toxin [Deltaproteobacteria bacterium]
MNYSLSFLNAVEDDSFEAFLWYEKKSMGLGEEFLRIFYACAGDLQKNPLVYTKVYKDFRRRLLKRFPYAIYYRIEKRTIVIYGLFHCARNPVTFETALGDRQKNKPLKRL